MKIIKTILTYLAWILLCLCCGFLYMRIILGKEPEPATGVLSMFNWLHEYVLFYVGAIIGSIIAFIYVVVDLSYLKSKLKFQPYKFLKRIGVILLISVIVGVTHYMLEKVIDVI